MTGHGGGISNKGGNVTLVDSYVRTNVAFDTHIDEHIIRVEHGGGISNDFDGTLTVRESNIDSNASE